MDIEDGTRGAGGVRGEQRGLEEPVRVALHQVAILEDAGLAFLAVDDEVLRGALRLAARRPLHRRPEVGAAAPGEACRAHLLDHPLGARVLERVHQRRVRPVADRVGDVRGVREAAALEEDVPLTPEPVAADVGRCGGVRRQRVEESRDMLGGDGARREPRTAVAQDLDDRLGPAHAVAARGDDGEGEAAALDLEAQRLERLARADGAPARSQADGEARARAPALGLAPERREARHGRAGRGPRRRGDARRCGRGVRGGAGGEEGVERARRYTAMARVVDLDDGRDGAGEGAVHRFERHRAVSGGLARAEAEPSLARGEQLAAAAELAAHAGANPDDACPGQGEPELRVVRRDAPHLAFRNAQVRRDRLQRLRGEIAFGALDRLERRQEPRPFAGKLRQELGHCHRREAYHAGKNRRAQRTRSGDNGG